jgi:hypothetical protein
MSNHSSANGMRSERGTVTIEVAFASVLLLALVLGIVDFARMHFCRSRLQYAVSQATRFAVIGNSLPNPGNPSQQLSRGDSIVHLIRNLSGLPNIQSSDVSISSINANGQSAAGPGGPGDVVTVLATYRVPLVAPYLASAFENNEYEFQCVTSFRNEEFSGS